MSTKAYLSAIVLAISGTAFAADVVSANIVGYITVTAPKGLFTIIANQLDNGKGNKVADLIPSALNGTVLYKYGAAGYELNTAETIGPVTTWDDPAATLKPGEACFVLSPNGAQSFTFAGDVKGINGESSFAPTLVKKAFTLVSSVVPVDTKAKDLGLPLVNGDVIYTYVNPGGYVLNTFEAGVGLDSPDDLIKVGQGFFVNSAADANRVWNRVFNVN